MPTPKTNQHKEYARYAAHCLGIVGAARDQASRSVLREMAAEWLRLAELALESKRKRPRRWAVRPAN